MNKIKAYIILKKVTDEQLQEVVNEFIGKEEGWEPQGGVGVLYDNSDDKYYHSQAMIRREDQVVTQEIKMLCPEIPTDSQDKDCEFDN